MIQPWAAAGAHETFKMRGTHTYTLLKAAHERHKIQSTEQSDGCLMGPPKNQAAAESLWLINSTLEYLCFLVWILKQRHLFMLQRCCVSVDSRTQMLFMLLVLHNERNVIIPTSFCADLSFFFIFTWKGSFQVTLACPLFYKPPHPSSAAPSLGYGTRRCRCSRTRPSWRWEPRRIAETEHRHEAAASS